MDRARLRQIIIVFILVGLYVLLGNSKSVQPNLFIPGAVIAVAMVVPVLAGILFGRWVGFLVGLLGTAFNYFTPAGSIFELLAIFPHAIMGFVAGLYRGKIPSPLLSLAVVIGHALNLLLYWLFRLIPAGTFSSLDFWLGLGYEIFIDVITITILVGLYNLAFSQIGGQHGTHNQ